MGTDPHPPGWEAPPAVLGTPPFEDILLALKLERMNFAEYVVCCGLDNLKIRVDFGPVQRQQG